MCNTILSQTEMAPCLDVLAEPKTLKVTLTKEDYDMAYENTCLAYRASSCFIAQAVKRSLKDAGYAWNNVCIGPSSGSCNEFQSQFNVPAEVTNAFDKDLVYGNKRYIGVGDSIEVSL